MGNSKRTDIQNPLARAMNRAGEHKITPGNNPPTVPGQDNFEKLSGFAARIGRGVNNALQRLNSTGSTRSPSTVKDKR